MAGLDLDPAALWATMPFAATLGAELLEATPEAVRARVAWDEARCTVGGVLHGGVLMALADSAGALCGFLNLPPRRAHDADAGRPDALVRRTTVDIA